MKKCPYCSAEILDNAEFCLHCMKQLNKKQAAPSKSFFPKKRIIWIVAVVLLFSLIPLCLFLGNGKKEVASTHSTSVSNALQTFSSGNVIISGNGGGASEVNIGGSSASSTSSRSTSHGASSSSSAGGTTSTSSDTVSSKIEYVADPSNFKYEENATGYTVLGFSDSPLEEVIIPETYNGKPVTKIADRAFYAKTEIRTVYIPGCVKIIGAHAFGGCNFLNNLTISEGVTEIGRSAFIETSVETLIIPKTLTNYGWYCFKKCNTKTAIMKGVPKEAPKFLFSTCKNLENVTLPEGLTEISGAMFSGCEALKTLDIPESVTKVSVGAFSSCWRLEQIDLKNVETLESGAFEGCSSLKKVIISKKMKKIQGNVFSECSALSDIYYEGTKAQWQSIFKYETWNRNTDSGNVFGSCIIHCSDGDIKL